MTMKPVDFQLGCNFFRIFRLGREVRESAGGKDYGG